MPVGCGFLSAFLDQLAGTEIDTYSDVGTSGTITIPLSGVGDTLVAEMSRVITGCVADDELLITFDCSLYAVTMGNYNDYARFKVKVNGVQLGQEQRAGAWGAATARARGVVSMTRAYTIPADGDYTITVTWVSSDATIAHYQIQGSRRTLTIEHIIA